MLYPKRASQEFKGSQRLFPPFIGKIPWIGFDKIVHTLVSSEDNYLDFHMVRLEKSGSPQYPHYGWADHSGRVHHKTNFEESHPPKHYSDLRRLNLKAPLGFMWILGISMSTTQIDVSTL